MSRKEAAVWRGHTSTPAKSLMWFVQDGKCFYCFRKMINQKGKKRGKCNKLMLTLDHLIPRDMGGTACVVAACFECNNKKANAMPTREEVLNFRALMQTSVYMASARSHQRRAIEEIDHYLAIGGIRIEQTVSASSG